MVIIFRSWWQKIKTRPVATVLIAVVVALVVLVILGGYNFHWDWTGFNGNNKSGKTLWDWMQLLFIPVVLAIAGFWFNHRERKAVELRAENERKAAELRAQTDREIEQQHAVAEQEIALDNQREAALQAYINEMSELLLHENLRESKPENEVRKIARVRTLTVLPRLDQNRKRSVLKFLYESALVNMDKSIINLGGVDLSNACLSVAYLSRANLRAAILCYANLEAANLTGADLSFADLESANLREANLMNAKFGSADLMGTDMSKADLRGADMSKADISGANLEGADLRGANFTIEQLDKTLSLKGANMPDGSIHP